MHWPAKLRLFCRSSKHDSQPSNELEQASHAPRSLPAVQCARHLFLDTVFTLSPGPQVPDHAVQLQGRELWCHTGYDAQGSRAAHPTWQRRGPGSLQGDVQAGALRRRPVPRHSDPKELTRVAHSTGSHQIQETAGMDFGCCSAWLDNVSITATCSDVCRCCCCFTRHSTDHSLVGSPCTYVGLRPATYAAAASS